MAVEGTLGVFHLPEILQLIAQQGKTGILTVQGQHDMVAISFLRGDIVYADALNQPAEEGLERVLVGDGLVRREDFAHAAADVQAGAGRLIDLLVERGHVSRQNLLAALRLQTFRLLEQLLLWEEGEFKFFSGEEVSYEEGFAPIRVQDLLIRSIEHLEEERREAPAAAPPTLVPPEPVPRATAPTPPAPSPAPAPALPSIAPQRPPMSIAPPPAQAEELLAAEEEPEAPPVAAPLPAPRWPAALLAAGLAVLLAAGLVLAPHLLLLPFPFQRGEREALVEAQRASLYAKLDRAARTFFVLDGHFPERLETLRARGLLGAADLRDPEGRPLAWTVGQDSYAVRPLAGEGAGAPLRARGSIRGDFQLDPEFVSARPEGQPQPLILLD